MIREAAGGEWSSGGAWALESGGVDPESQPSHLLPLGLWTSFLTWNSYINLVCKKRNNDSDYKDNSCSLPLSVLMPVAM